MRTRLGPRCPRPSIAERIGFRALDTSVWSTIKHNVRQALDNLASTRVYYETGLTIGGELSVNGADPAKFDIADGRGIIVDSYNDPESPVIAHVKWSGITAQTVTNLATQARTFVSIDSDGAIVQQSAEWIPEERRNLILLGVLAHGNNTSISATPMTPHTSFSRTSQAFDFIEAIGPINVTGNVFSANGANLQINKSAGESFRLGDNYTVSKQNPSIVVNASQTIVSFQYRYQDGSGGITEDAAVTLIDPTLYDDGSGTLAAVAGSDKWQVQRIWMFSNGSVKIMPGQNLYRTQADAEASIAGAVFNADPILSNAIFRCWLIVKSTTTLLNDMAQALFIEADQFGTSSAGGASSSTTTMQQAYDNSSPDPEIMTNAIQGAITLRRGSAADTDNILELQDNDADQVCSITGQGKASFGDPDGSSVSDILTLSAKNAADDVVNCLLLKGSRGGANAAAGFGLSNTIQLENDAGALHDAAKIEYVWDDAADASEDCRLDISLMVAGSLVNKLKLNNTGIVSPTIVTPTIASFTNAQHDHADAAGGGLIAEKFRTKEFGFLLPSPVTGDTGNYHWLFPYKADLVDVYLAVDAATNVVANLHWRLAATPKSATGEVKVWTADKTVTTTNTKVTSFNNANPGGNNYALALIITSVSGTPAFLRVYGHAKVLA